MNQQELKEYSLYLEDNNFFSNIFIESNEIKSFIFERYAKGSCWWMRKADVQQMVIDLNETEQKILYVDVAYLIQAGQYNENQKNVRINKISKLLSCPKERTTKILYYMEKEKI